MGKKFVNLIAFGFAIMALFATAVLAEPSRPSKLDITEDFDFLWTTINNNYGYFDRKHVNWQKAGRIYRTQARAAHNRQEFIAACEGLLDELYDPHTHLKSNTPASTRLIPTGLDLWAEWRNGRAVVTQVRPGFGAAQTGVKPGMVITAVNDVSTEQAVAARLGKALTADPAARQWALLAVLAGRHDTPRTLRVEGIDKPFEPDAPGLHYPDDERYDPPLDWRVLDGNIGYLRIRDLGSPEVNAIFDAAMAKLADTRGLLLDLRETPRGGNTGVGEHVMGAFLDRETPYQMIIPPNGQSWLKTVIPAPPERRYTKPLIVIVDRWTGSMGEGVAVGLCAAKRATIVGSPMAGLNGEVYDLAMPHSGIGFQFSANKIFLPDGAPRE
jgi:C-terminal processing protease CtpA/Prc